MIAKMLVNYKIRKITKSYILVLTDLLEFREYLTSELTKPNQTNETKTNLLQSKHNVLMTIRNVVSVARSQGIHISRLVWNDVEIDI